MTRIVLYTADWWGHVCPVIRVLSPASRLGFEVLQGGHWEGGQFLVQPEMVLNADIVVIQRDFPRFIKFYEQVMEVARKNRKPVIYEIDDWLLELPATHPDSQRYEAARVAILQAILEADAVTCSTTVLAAQLSKFNKNVIHLANYLDENLWQDAINEPRLKNPKSARPLVIGYMGGYGHISDLESIKPVLMKILRHYGDKIRMHFWVCPPPIALQGWKNVVWTRKSYVNYSEFARYFSKQECDIFIAPLADSFFNQAKSSIKFLEYSILGVPGVYSDALPYKDVIINGENGFLANNLQEWEMYLVQLIENSNLRQEIGQRARETVMERWLLGSHAEKWQKAYEQVTAAQEFKLPGEIVVNSLRALENWNRTKSEELLHLQLISSQIEADFENAFSHSEKNINSIKAELLTKEQLLQEIFASPGWKLITLIRAIRSRIAPPGSLRERVVFRAESSLYRLIARLRIIARNARPTVDSQSASDLAKPMPPLTSPLTQPLISIVVESSNKVDARSVQAWIDNQTYPSAEVVVWERTAARACRIGSEDDCWEASTLQSLIDGLRGAYVCLATPNLLQETETCLENALIALESEALIFAIIWQGDPSSVKQWLRLGWIPKISEYPCVYIVRKDAVREDFLPDLLNIPIHGQPVVVGKIISRPVNRKVVEETPPSDAGLGVSVAEPAHVVLSNLGKISPAFHLHASNRIDIRENDILLLPTTEGEQKSETSSYPTHSDRKVIALPPLPHKDSRPAVLVVMPFLAVGGAERLTLEVMYQLKEEICFILATVEQHNPALGTTAEMFYQITPYVFNTFDWLSPHLRLSYFEYLLKRFSPRALYIANGASWIYDALGHIKLRSPHLWVANQVYDHRAGWINRYDPILIEYINAHIACNKEISRAYIQRGVPLKNVYLIENGIDSEQFDPERYPEDVRHMIRERMGVPIKGKVVTFMGRLHPQKRPMDFVELARRFAQRSDLTFLMVGDGPLSKVVDAEVKRIGLRNLVRQPFRQAADVLAISDVLVLPSEYEGMPMVVLEAQAMGKPVVVTDVGNNREVIQITRGGVVVQTIGDIRALAQGVEKMLQSPPDPIQLRRAVAISFDIRRIARLYKNALLGGI